jgi:hypothetical protein
MFGTFGSELYLPNDTLYDIGSSEIYIAKFDENGNNIWSKTLMDPSNTTEDGEIAFAAFDSVNQCIYITGSFCQSNYFSRFNHFIWLFRYFFSKNGFEWQFYLG